MKVGEDRAETCAIDTESMEGINAEVKGYGGGYVFVFISQ